MTRRERLDRANICKDKAGLILFPSNTINPDVPLDNIKAFWDEVLCSIW